jgi:hypothetical protein
LDSLVVESYTEEVLVREAKDLSGNFDGLLEEHKARIS